MPTPADLLGDCDQGLTAATRILAAAAEGTRAQIEALGGSDGAQAAAHGYAWLATYVEALQQMQRWAWRLEGENRFDETAKLLLVSAFGEYLAQIGGGIPMSQGEFVRLGDLGVPSPQVEQFRHVTEGIVEAGTRAETRWRLAEVLLADTTADLI